MSESDIVRSCLQFLKAKGIYAWRSNNVGVFNYKTKGYFFHGLRGVSDILGILPQKCPCALQGVLLAIECKVEGKNPTNEQSSFLREITERGGIAIVAHSIEELSESIEPYIL